MNGWAGKILRVDLTSEEIWQVPTSDYVPKFIGGWGIAAKIVWDELDRDVRAFDPGNRLIITTGPLTGTLFPGTGRAEICTISPATYSFQGPSEDYIRSGIGGQWAPELKFAGYDAVVIEGQATRPVWIRIEDHRVRILSAAGIWGMDTYSTQEAIWGKMGAGAKVLCIGPAGEKRVRYATIATDNGNHAGVGGTGAVMGAKNLKAIAVRGTGKINVAEAKKVYDLAYKMQRLRYRPEARPPFGLYGLGQHRLGGGGEVKNKALIRHMKTDTFKALACWGCPVACRPVFKVSDGIRPGISNFCSGLSRFRNASRDFYGNYTKAYIKVVGLIDGAGINCHEIDSIIAWLDGCYKEGLLKESDTGISLALVGSYDFYRHLVDMIQNRKDFGDILAEGVHRASDRLGGIGKSFVKDINRGFHEVYYPRILPTSAFVAAFESSQRLPMYHTWATRFLHKHCEEPAGRGWLTNEEWVNRIKELFGDRNVIDLSDDGFYHPDKAFLAKWTEDYKTAAAGCFIICDWIMGHFWSWYSDEPNRRERSLELESQAFSVTTGIKMDTSDMITSGERVRNLERAVMVREGRRRRDDTIASYCFKAHVAESEPQTRSVPMADGHWKAVSRNIDPVKWEELKNAYYVERGWDPTTGIPKREKLEALDLADIADDMDDIGLLSG